MYKRFISVALAILITISAFPLSVSAATAVISASYNGGVLTYTGTGFDSTKSYVIRFVDNNNVPMVSTTGVQPDAYGNINVTQNLGIISDLDGHKAYVDTVGGSSGVASATTIENNSIYYYITVVPGDNGTGRSFSERATSGETVTLEGAPTQQGYKLTGWEVIKGGTVNGNTLTVGNDNVVVKPIFSSLEPNIFAEYRDGVVTYNGGEFHPNTQYTIRIVYNSVMHSFTLVTTDANGAISNATANVGTLAAGIYKVYVDGSSGSSVANAEFTVGSHNLTVKANPLEGGTATIAGGGTDGSYAGGTKVDITAVANPGYVFNGWTVSGGGSFENATRAGTVFTMPDGNATITANFINTDVTVTSVTVNPATASVAKGDTQSFTATVTGNNSPAQTVTWSVAGNKSANTKISDSGLLTVDSDETAATLTITATSTFDATKSGTATVTVTQTGGTPTVSSVTVNPAATTVSKGSAQQFNAIVNGTNNPAQTVTWSVLGNKSSSTKISSDGLLVVGFDESATTLTVRATAAADTSKYGTAVVTVSSTTVNYYSLTVRAGTGGTAYIYGGSTSGDYAAGTAVSIVAAPNNNYAFNGWSTSSGSFDNASNARTTFYMPAGDATVTAHFIYTGGSSSGSSDSSGTSGGSGGTTTTYYTVSFNTNGGSSVASTSVTSGKTITAPSEPTKTGYVFGGWYKDADLTEAWNFSTDKLTGNITLYAKWISEEYIKANQTIASVNGVSMIVAKSGDGGVILTSADIAAYGGNNFKMKFQTAVNNPDNPNAYVMALNGELLPISLFDGKNIYALTSLSGTYSVIYNPVSFTDIIGHWAEKAIEFVASRKLYSGMGGGLFDPDMPMTRAMFATVLANLDGADVSGYTISRFIDVEDGMWYTPYIEWAADRGIVSGVGDGFFEPNASITREQMATMLLKYIQYKGYQLKEVAEPFEYVDASDIAWWAIDAVAFLQQTGIESGRPDGTFAPQAYASRAEVASIFTYFIIAMFN